MNNRPLLLLDVDGPLNPYAAKPSRRPTGYQTHRLRPEGWKDPHVRPLRVWLNPEHGEQLLALPYDLVWCTTWAHEANTMIGPVIGLPKLPVITWPQDARETATEGLFWKTQHVIEWAAGRPFAWVDDDFTDADRALVAEQHAGPALLHYVNPRLGLLPSDAEALTAWAVSLAEEPSACGKCRQPFAPADTRFDGHAQHAATPYCRACVDLCHDNNAADHRCVICA